MPKSERSNKQTSSNDRNPNKAISNDRSFGFQRCLKTERSVFGQTIKLHHFIYKGGHKNYFYIYKTVQLSLSEIQTIHLRPERPKSELDLFERSSVQISALSENRTFGFRTLTVHTQLVHYPYFIQTLFCVCTCEIKYSEE